MFTCPHSLPTAHENILALTRDIKAKLLSNVKNGCYFDYYPDAAEMQTPFAMHRHHTGMQSFEWNILQYHILKNWRIIAAFYPNINVVDERQIDYVDIPTTPQRLLQPFIPRLDTAMLSYNHKWVLAEITGRLDCQTIGELLVKARIFQRRHKLGPKIDHLQVIYLNENPIVEHEATAQSLFPENVPVRLYRYDIKEIVDHIRKTEEAQT